jgi:hypothetical protein
MTAPHRTATGEENPAMTSPASYQPGDRIALEYTADPHTRLRPGDQGTVTRWDPAQGQLGVNWDSGSTLSMLPGEGDQVRLLTRAAGEDGTEPDDPLATRAADLGRDAGRAAATWVFDGNTPEDGYRRVLRGINESDPAILDAIEPSATGPGTGYDEDDLARDLGVEPDQNALPRAAAAYTDAFTSSFWHEVERTAREHLG